MHDGINLVIRISASVFITCGIIAFGIIAYKNASNTTVQTSKEMNQLSSDLSESDFYRYNGKEVQGDDVLNCIKEVLGEYGTTDTSPVYVYVVTSQSSNTYVNSACIDKISDFTETNYINPLAKFRGEVIKNKNKVIIGINFTQE